MKTLKDKQDYFTDGINYTDYFDYEDVKETLQNFHKEYWKESETGDKFKQYIDCDVLDFLIDKHFGHIIDIETFQFLPNQDKEK